MYSPQPPRDGGWWRVRGVWRGNGTERRAAVDVLRGLRDGVWDVEEGLEAEETQRTLEAPVEAPSRLYRSSSFSSI